MKASEYDLGFDKSGPDHYTSRNNAWTVAKAADGAWDVRQHGMLLKPCKTMAQAIAFANTEAGVLAGYPR